MKAPYGMSKRDPVNHRTKRQEIARTRGEQATKPEKRKRAQRNAARGKLMKAGVVKRGDGKDVDHKRGLTGGNTRSNLRVTSAASNRGRGGAKSKGGTTGRKG